MTKVKICGFTEPNNARDAALAGVDAIGLVFYDKSPRNVDIHSAQKIIEALPPFINRVGLFVNANPSFIDEILCEVPLDTLQFHGDESVLDCAQYQMPFIKSLRVKPDTNVKEIAENFSSASALLLDSFSPSSYGGTGESFDWSLACVKISLPIILAGGLTVDNVADAIKQVNPYAVDASSGVESAPGVKDIDMLCEIISKNNEALEVLKNKHQVDIRSYPEEVLNELYEISTKVVKELSLSSDFAKEVYNSYTSFHEKTRNWNEISIKSYLNTNK